MEIEPGRSVWLTVRREHRFQSLHTGRDLVELHGWVRTRDREVHRWLSMALRGLGDRPVRAEDGNGSPLGKWVVSWNSYGESEGVHTYSLILQESEELALDFLRVDGAELHPYEYRERVVDDRLTIWAKMVGTRDDVKRLTRLLRTRASFPVVREGIQAEPREMRLGVAEWSAYEDRIKYRLVLLDREINETTRRELLRIQEETNRAALGYYANLTERLVGKLVERGLLTDEELTQIREAARAELDVPQGEFWQVADVDLL